MNGKNKPNHKNNSMKAWHVFFGKWTFIGSIVILISVILRLEYAPNNIYLDVLAQVLQTIGIAMLLGALFDLSKNSKIFTEFVSNLLADIVVSKSFLAKLSEKDKKEALSMILKPSDNQLEQYANINEYFKKQINKTLSMFETNFKSNLVLTIDVKKDSLTHLVTSAGTLSYRIYKVRDSYEPIPVIFEKNNSELLKRKIIFPGGTKELTEQDFIYSEETSAGIEYKKYQYIVPDELHKHSYLTVESEIIEPGHDHWTNFQWTSLTPYDGFTFNLKCHDDLMIKEHIVFDEKDPYLVKVSDDKKSISILSTEWLNAYTGFSITIGDGIIGTSSQK